MQVKSWDEIRKASAFSKRWKGARDGLPCYTGVKNRSVGGIAKGGVGYAYDSEGHLSHVFATNAAGRVFSVAYTNLAGYSYGYAITTPGGDEGGLNLYGFCGNNAIINFDKDGSAAR